MVLLASRHGVEIEYHSHANRYRLMARRGRVKEDAAFIFAHSLNLLSPVELLAGGMKHNDCRKHS